MLLDLHRKKFGEFLPLIRRQDVKGFVTRRPIWINRPLAIDTVREFAPRADVPDLSTGDAVRHSTLGAGIVTRIEAGGVVTVRFEDGSARRLR